MLSFWVTVNDRDYSERTRRTRHLAPRSRASIKRTKLRKVAETAIAGEGGGEKSGDSARRQGSVRVTERDVLTGKEVRLHAASQLPEWCLA
jgi:hypothetical protein